jgi:hypothetical protein
MTMRTIAIISRIMVLEICFSLADIYLCMSTLQYCHLIAFLQKHLQIRREEDTLFYVCYGIVGVICSIVALVLHGKAVELDVVSIVRSAWQGTAKNTRY